MRRGGLILFLKIDGGAHKGVREIVQPEMQILSLFTRPHAVPKHFAGIFTLEKRMILRQLLLLFTTAVYFDHSCQVL